MAQYAADLGFAPVPDDASEEVEPFATSRTSVVRDGLSGSLSAVST